MLEDSWFGRIAAAEGLFVVDERQRIVHWSSAAQRILGFSPEEVTGQPCYLALMGREPTGHPVCRQNCQVIANARRGRGTASYEVIASGRDGIGRCVGISVLVLGGLKKRSFRVLHLFREIGRRPFERSSDTAPRAETRPPVEHLTRRELQVLRLFAAGSTNAEVAEALHISAYTARNHVASIQRKLGARNRLEIVLLSMRAGLL
ncbi:MAG TPA: LuxR C-terminal-related transcriptional regulator [Candidatus Limnocylindria bacterium]|nr:LuxR C-terminal-related transcriptional regulator [Candidatus Limnocylindria bacterium]